MRKTALTRFALVGVFATFAVTVLSSKSAVAESCYDLYDFIKQTASGSLPYFDSWTFQSEGRGDNILLLFKDNTKRNIDSVKHWAFVTRHKKETNEFCIAGQGNEFGRLMDMHTNASEARFGMPGSGQPRCSSFKEALPGSLLVRMWANRELGESTILYTASSSTSGFHFWSQPTTIGSFLKTKKNLPNQLATTNEVPPCLFHRT